MPARTLRIRLGIGLLAALWLLGTGRPAAADTPRDGSDLDGIYIALGPLGSAIRNQGSWGGAFGGEVSVTRVTERRPLAALGAAIGGMRYSDRDAGHLWADLSIATRRPFDVPVGVSVGPTVEVDRVIPPRFGAHATLWVFVGVMPYVRAGAIEKSGRYVELGLQLRLPAIRL